MSADARLTELESTLSALGACWSRIAPEIEDRIANHTLKLIGENNEQTRGAIKALRELLTLPATLQFERDQIAAALSEESDAAN